MGKLLEAFPLLESETLVIRKRTEDDADSSWQGGSKHFFQIENGTDIDQSG